MDTGWVGLQVYALSYRDSEELFLLILEKRISDALEYRRE